jgi:hypothetical protein
VSACRHVVLVTSSSGAQAMSPAATTRTPLSAPKSATDDGAVEGGASLPPPSPGLHATTSDKVAAADTSAPILLRLPTPMNLITPP